MPDDKGKKSNYDQLLEASSLGLMFPIAIGLGFGIGYGLDRLFHTGHVLTWIFTAFGIIAAFINLFRTGMGNDG